MCFGLFRRGRGRPPTMPGAVGNASQLAITTQPSASAQNNVNFAVTPVIQLQDAQGVNVPLAGVEIIVSAITGSAATATYTATLPGPNGGSLTDSTGKATYSAFKLTGVTGARRIEFAAVGDAYTHVLSNTVSIVAGAASAPQTTLAAGDGTVGVLEVVTIQVRDLSGNALTTGGATVVVTISGANSVGPSPATDLANGSYQFSYTPATDGSDTITVTMNGVAIGNSGAVITINPAAPVVSSARLRLGLFNLAVTDIGKGPNNSIVPPLYGATVAVVSPSTISAIIDAADAADVLVFANFAGARTSWTDAAVSGDPCFGTPNIRIYRPSGDPRAKYQARIQAYSEAAVGTALYNKIVDALARRRLVAYVVDEPFHNQFCGTVSKTQVNEMAQWHKDVFGRSNTITCVRVCAARTDGVLAMSPAPVGGYPDVDYLWLQYEGTLHQPRYPGTSAQSALDFYLGQLPVVDTLDMGVIFGGNLLDGGSATCWAYQNTSTSGRIVGTFVQPGSPFTPGQSVSCGTAVGTQTRWFSLPSEVLALQAAILGNATLRGKSPCLMLWSHSPRNVEADDIFVPLEARADIVTMLRTLITQGDARTTWDGWRTPK